MDVLSAIAAEKPQHLQAAIAAGADPNLIDLEGVPATLHAAETGNPALMRVLIEMGANLEATDTIGWTALMAAIPTGSEPLITLLLAHGANINHVAREDTPLTTAAGEAPLATVRLLLEHGADANLRRPDGWTPLMLAAFTGSCERIRLLLEHGADPTVTMGHRLMDAATIAAAHHHREARDLLMEAARTAQTELQELWAMVHKWCEAEAPELAERFENTTSDQVVPERWARLPEDAQNQLTGWPPGLPLYDYASLSADESLLAAENMIARAAEGEFVGRSCALSGDEPIKRVHWSEAWVPLARDREGNMLLVDLDPEPTGVLGQLISWSFEQGPLAVLASGITPYLRHMLVRIRRGEIRWDKRAQSITQST